MGKLLDAVGKKGFLRIATSGIQFPVGVEANSIRDHVISVIREAYPKDVDYTVTNKSIVISKYSSTFCEILFSQRLSKITFEIKTKNIELISFLDDMYCVVKQQVNKIWSSHVQLSLTKDGEETDFDWI